MSRRRLCDKVEGKLLGVFVGSYVVLVEVLFVLPADWMLVVFLSSSHVNMAVQLRRDDIRAAMLVIPISLQLDAVGICFSLIVCKSRSRSRSRRGYE